MSTKDAILKQNTKENIRASMARFDGMIDLFGYTEGDWDKLHPYAKFRLQEIYLEFVEE